MDATPEEAGVEVEDAAPAETPVRRRPRKPKPINWNERVKVKNLTTRKINTPSGSVLPRDEGEMSRLDASRMSAYVEIIDG